MNTIDFTKQGGFPFDQDVLNFLQNSILSAAGSAHLGGQTYVLSGCEEIGGNIANGVVVIDGEILPFAGGAKQDKVVIIEQTQDMNYEDGSVYPSIKTRFATFGDDGVTNLQWSSFKRNTAEGVLARLERLERIAAPFLAVRDAEGVEHRGGMVLWKKPAILIPVGWQEVVDWRGRLPMGYDPNDPLFNSVGYAGGSKDRTLSMANLPAKMPLSFSIYHENGSTDIADGGGGTGQKIKRDFENAGGGQSFSLINPYRTVMFIEYTGV